MSLSDRPPRVLFVCLGNICRSPLAEGILRRKAAERGLQIEVDSAGTGNWHVGELPDSRARAVGRARGCAMDMRARQVSPDDLRYFDLIAVMDHDNLRDLSHVRGYDQARVRLARSFAPDAAGDEVPDPYYGGPEGFERVADMLEAACEGILDHLFGAF